MHYILVYFVFSVYEFLYVLSQIRNASALLFSALVTRIFGVKKSRALATSRYDLYNCLFLLLGSEIIENILLQLFTYSFITRGRIIFFHQRLSAFTQHIVWRPRNFACLCNLYSIIIQCTLLQIIGIHVFSALIISSIIFLIFPVLMASPEIPAVVVKHLVALTSMNNLHISIRQNVK